MLLDQRKSFSAVNLLNREWILGKWEEGGKERLRFTETLIPTVSAVGAFILHFAIWSLWFYDGELFQPWESLDQEKEEKRERCDDDVTQSGQSFFFVSRFDNGGLITR